MAKRKELITIVIGDTDEDADWILTPEERKEEIALHEELEKAYAQANRSVLERISDAIRGGPGSGNWGHGGLPGVWGGSSSKKGGGGGGAGAKKKPSTESAAVVAKDIATQAKELEPAITKTVTSAVKESGGRMEGLEFRLKTEESLTRKIKAEAEDRGTNPREAANARINDAVRYTAIFNEKDYGAGVANIQAKLAEQGWERHDNQFKNYWEPGQPYAGYNCVFTNKAGFRFELQFHTEKSIKTKEVSHLLYEKARVLPKGAERTSLENQMRDLWQAVPRPSNWRKLPGVNMAEA